MALAILQVTACSYRCQAAKRWSPESVIHDRVFRQNASMCYYILLWVGRPITLPPLGSGGYEQPLKSAKSHKLEQNLQACTGTMDEDFASCA